MCTFVTKAEIIANKAHIRIFVCRDLVHLDSSGPHGVSSRLLGSHRVTHLCIVCVCAPIHTVYTCVYARVAHIHPHTLPPELKIERHRQHPYFSFCQKQPPTPSNKCCYRLVEPPHPHSPMLNETNCTYMRAYAHPAASVKQMCTIMFTTSVERTHLHMHGAQQHL